MEPSQSFCISHLLKTHQSLDEAVLDTGPVLTHSKNGLDLLWVYVKAKAKAIICS